MLGRWMSEKTSVCMYGGGEEREREREVLVFEDEILFFIYFVKYFFKYIYIHKQWVPPPLYFFWEGVTVYGVCCCWGGKGKRGGVGLEKEGRGKINTL